jgi:hypothetical protein
LKRCDRGHSIGCHVVLDVSTLPDIDESFVVGNAHGPKTPTAVTL